MSSKVSRYPGTEITSKESREEKYLVSKYKTVLRYSWAAGKATSRFMEGLKDGEIWGRRCEGCGRTLVPPRMYCERCFRPTTKWVRLKDTGRIVTYSISYVNADASRRVDPILVAVIEIDGASEMMGLLHVLGEVSPERVEVGMKVKAVWKARRERGGAITDIAYFRPIDVRSRKG